MKLMIMKPIRMFAMFAALILSVMVSACSFGGSSSVIGPTSSPTSEIFAGTVDVAGTDSHNFNVVESGGQVNVTLTAAGPPATIFMGLALGNPSGTTCVLLSGAQTLAQAATTSQLSGTVNAGTYCVAVFDVGNQSAQVAYSVTVSHF